MRQVIFLGVLVFAACNGAPSGGQPQATSGAPVEQGRANAPFQPAFAGQTRAPEQRSNVTIETREIATGLNHPWSVAVLPDGNLLVTERAGRLRLITPGGQISDPIAGLPEVFARGQGGLLDVALSPNFASDRLIYWSYAEPRGGDTNSTSVARGRLNANATAVENAQRIFQQNPAWASNGHFGSRLTFDREGRLYITLGDRQGDDSRGFAQDRSNTIGKVVRINADGTVPSDNPFVGQAGVAPEIWSYGHRNVQGADFHPDTGALWTLEHGPRGGDELNLDRPGLNYGWPVISYGIEYRGAQVTGGIAVQEGLEQPVYYWDPVIAPGDMDFYRGSLFPWRGDIVIAGLNTRSLIRVRLDGDRVVGEERFALGVGRIRDLAEAADGAIYIVTDEDNGRVIRLTPRA